VVFRLSFLHLCLIPQSFGKGSLWHVRYGEVGSAGVVLRIGGCYPRKKSRMSVRYGAVGWFNRRVVSVQLNSVMAVLSE